MTRPLLLGTVRLCVRGRWGVGSLTDTRTDRQGVPLAIRSPPGQARAMIVALIGAVGALHLCSVGLGV